MRFPLAALLLIAARYCAGCWTQAGMLGDCVNIKKCEPVMSLLKSRPPLRVYNELRYEHCGFDGQDPKICCERQRPASRAVEDNEIPTTVPPTPSPIHAHPALKLLEHELCGPVKTAPKIYGGSAARLFEFPWMGLLAYLPDGREGHQEFRCAGTIINKNYLLTAAHCVTNLPENLKFVGVRVGEHNLAKKKDCESYDNGAAYICAEKFQEFGIEKIHVHPDYSNNTLQNDIALVRINGTMNFKPASVRPICLPLGSSWRLDSSKGLVTGWGSTESGSFNSDVLLKVALPVVQLEKCVRAYRDQPYVKLWHKQICAGGLGAKDSCNGDSGGPLQSIGIYRGRVRLIQHGVVSFGRRNCAVKGSPGVYTNVAYYLQWILDTIME